MMGVPFGATIRARRRARSRRVSHAGRGGGSRGGGGRGGGGRLQQRELRRQHAARHVRVAPGAQPRVEVLQTIVGAIARHTNSPHALWTHVGNAFVVFLVGTIATAFAVGKLGDSPGIRGITRAIVLLLITQIALGFVALAIRNRAGKTPENVADLGTATVISAHVLVGAFLTVLVSALAAHVFRATRKP